MSEISPTTEALIDRMCRVVERKDFILDKKKAEELILKTYDLFDLQRPSKIVWCVDIFDKRFIESAESARSARSARSAENVRNAWSAESAWSAWSARSAESARSTESAWSAESAESAWSAWSALDYDFDWFVIEYEYVHNRENNPSKEPNENDWKYLEYSELLLQAIEAGLGYRVEHNDILYLVPTPIVRIDDHTPPRFHSLTEPAIRWKGGREFYFINGVKLDKKLWQEIVNKTITAKEVISLKNTEQKMVAMKHLGMEKVFSELNAEKISVSKMGTETLWLIKNVFIKDKYFLEKRDPSTGRVYYECVGSMEGLDKTADEALRWQMQVPKSKYDTMILYKIRT